MSKAFQATETIDLEEAEGRLSESEGWTDAILRRLEQYTPRKARLDVLDVGAAQGRTLLALQKLGHHAVGVEPFAEAIETAHRLAARVGTTVDIREGAAESLPFPDRHFDVVLATSVMEHVVDLPCALREIHRVLRPGGVFWFNSASSLAPHQDEISAFPLFGWYPLPLKRKIMAWAAQNRPELVGGTTAPAINWFTPWSARRELRRAGFAEVWDRWDLRRPSEESGRAARAAVSVAKRFPVTRILGDVAIAGCSYAARKGLD
jgi:2-polyprenyl-6-hydroxyphenyl methylase/3-demethylubiquinone-9 3-methyltransferase